MNNGYFIFCPRCPSTVAIRQGEDAWLLYISLQSVVVVAASGDFCGSLFVLPMGADRSNTSTTRSFTFNCRCNKQRGSPPQHCSSKVALAPDMWIQDVSYTQVMQVIESCHTLLLDVVSRWVSSVLIRPLMLSD